MASNRFWRYFWASIVLGKADMGTLNSQLQSVETAATGVLLSHFVTPSAGLCINNCRDNCSLRVWNGQESQLPLKNQGSFLRRLAEARLTRRVGRRNDTTEWIGQ